jgi:hypothetical protein
VCSGGNNAQLGSNGPRGLQPPGSSESPGQQLSRTRAPQRGHAHGMRHMYALGRHTLPARLMRSERRGPGTAGGHFRPTDWAAGRDSLCIETSNERIHRPVCILAGQALPDAKMLATIQTSSNDGRQKHAPTPIRLYCEPIVRCSIALHTDSMASTPVRGQSGMLEHRSPMQLWRARRSPSGHMYNPTAVPRCY